ncbi:MAG: RluA family pseudouridine synthase [Pseudomonadota bacterium]
MSGVQKKRVTDDEDGMRLDRWFRSHFPRVRHGALEKYLRKGEVRVDGGRAKSNRRLQSGEEIRIPPLPNNAEKKSAKSSFRPEDRAAIESMIVYEDDAIIALNKPFGLATQGGAKTTRHLDGLLSSYISEAGKPRLVHRLDKDTGGLIIVAKSRPDAQRLADAFQSHDVEKTYWALVAGGPRPRQGTISMPIEKQLSQDKETPFERVEPVKQGGKDAVTDYQILDEAGVTAFVAFRPITGRTHQIRVHAAAIHHPIIGDRKYGGEEAFIDGVAPRLHLFCRSMSFRHPRTGRRMTLEAPLTEHMRETWNFFAFDAEADCEWPDR